MPEPESAQRGTSQSVFQNVTSPWMQSANVEENTEEFPLEDYKDQFFGPEERVEVKDARREEARDAERERKLELEKEEDLEQDMLEDERVRLCRRGLQGRVRQLPYKKVPLAFTYRSIIGNISLDTLVHRVSDSG
ncbi:hypothetical protein FGB62_5g146 [Gracilaria domingensis]|nr:hypothetical protein FGB62_5g146 [Gracilaria domingensis]